MAGATTARPRLRSRLGWRFRELTWVFTLCAALFLAWRSTVWFARPDMLDETMSRTIRIVRVIDGDTLLAEDGSRIRLLGVDTPETKHPERPVEKLGQEAFELTRRLVEGRVVRLEFDRLRRDHYHRFLAFVYCDDRLLNEELIRAGLSRAVTRFPIPGRMRDRLVRAERTARTTRVGLWADRSTIYATRPTASEQPQ